MASLNLQQIGDFSFSGEPFTTNLLELTFNNIPVKTITKSMFMGSSISALEIYYDSMSDGLNIEQDVLGQASSKVTSIALKYCLTNGEALKNLTGRGSLLTTLQILDLSYNSISKLPKQAFLKAPSLQILYLVSSGINEIELGAFDGLNEIIQLYINNNHLKTLSDGMFNDLIGLRSMFISGNPWNCNCDLQWLKEYLSIMPAIDYKRCDTDSGWVSFDEVDFCPSKMSTTSTSSITSTTTTSTEVTTSTETSLSSASTQTSKNDDSFLYERIWCRNLLMYSPEISDSTKNVIWYESLFKRRNIIYTFSELEATATYLLNISSIVEEKEYLIWTDVKNRSNYGCVFNISQSILLDLQYEKTYTICLASNDTLDNYALIADDCTAITTPPDWNHRAWYLNYQKITIIVSIVLTLISTIGITAAVVYFIVKYNPELIKGNKRILIVKTGSYSPKNVPVRLSSKIDDKRLSLYTDYEGYVSPRIKNWIGNQSNTKYEELGSNIDGIEMNAEDSTIYEPPPVPPNHPMKRRDSGRPYFHSNM
ncbi:unnamed protein product [Ceutorhynchus assimilis]|uniref:Uncharacterized protein n=1 Tax=Ceutorhynchus assimilis TaxID=467358 RepID=A0A9N9QJX4_9CUCU|nr:unnamed protein product [Ceutorhynchus assimilis]